MTDEIVNFPKKRGSANQVVEDQSRSHLFAATIARLAAASTQEYERLRSKEAKAIECRPGTLDRVVGRIRNTIVNARAQSNFEEDLPITPGTLMHIDGYPVFEVARLRFVGSSGYYDSFEGGNHYSFCVSPDGEASVRVGVWKDME